MPHLARRHKRSHICHTQTPTNVLHVRTQRTRQCVSQTREDTATQSPQGGASPTFVLRVKETVLAVLCGVRGEKRKLGDEVVPHVRASVRTNQRLRARQQAKRPTISLESFCTIG
jgi:hypothetical protein